jgi:antitoxin component of MazEF toxin-antitoxin module
MKVMVKKWGNSASVRIPAAVMAAAAVFLEQAVSRRTSVVRIIILTRPNVWRNFRVRGDPSPPRRHLPTPQAASRTRF